CRTRPRAAAPAPTGSGARGGPTARGPRSDRPGRAPPPPGVWEGSVPRPAPARPAGAGRPGHRALSGAPWPGRGRPASAGASGARRSALAHALGGLDDGLVAADLGLDLLADAGIDALPVVQGPVEDRIADATEQGAADLVDQALALRVVHDL